MNRRAVFLDRDGVVIDAGEGGTAPPRTPASVRVLPGVPDAIALLRQAGFEIVVVTNQPDVARGTATLASIEEVHEHLARLLGLEHFDVCPHDDIDGCPCRKPKPGMLVRSSARLGVDLQRSWMVGDRWVDIAAGLAARTATVLIERPYSWRANSTGHPPVGLQPDHREPDLAAAAALIVNER